MEPVGWAPGLVPVELPLLEPGPQGQQLLLAKREPVVRELLLAWLQAQPLALVSQPVRQPLPPDAMPLLLEAGPVQVLPVPVQA